MGPSITASMESAAQKVEAFFIKLSADEKFQQLGWGEKINYALSELIRAINEWMSGEGGNQVKVLGEQIGTFISIGLEGAAPILTKSAETAGKILGRAVISAFRAALESSPFGAILVGALGGAAIGSIIPGVGTAVGAAAGAGAGLVSHVVAKIAGGKGWRSGVADNIAIPHASGGILTRPHLGLVAEAGPEAIIPLDGSPHSISLWQKTGERLGVLPIRKKAEQILGVTGAGNSININVNFAPVVHGAGSEVIPALKEQQRYFLKELEEMIERKVKDLAYQKRRLSYA
ncbi:hypothetical protein MTBGP_09650 [Moorella thermoacetica]|uniref:hypothetical protein n=1 Tax=Neomoorella thermoacetica TaxID=1525 RepID=UPI0030D14819